ncbi:hypothetical protein BQ8794_240320 [Mesorhizobium prunaredense]|uniref:Uncharacterized protein n=1 Tax=Mesorhizobium prunaredense TaxID=1631249 RepID=A0A1R3V8G7_9HYPH|nr:hypothetical protein BQ8794_240320 [Mesorhizobium prunaredense]
MIGRDLRGLRYRGTKASYLIEQPADNMQERRTFADLLRATPIIAAACSFRASTVKPIRKLGTGRAARGAQKDRELRRGIL